MLVIYKDYTEMHGQQNIKKKDIVVSFNIYKSESGLPDQYYGLQARNT